MCCVSKDTEGRFCIVLLILLVLSSIISFIIVTLPVLISLTTHYEHATCYLHTYEEYNHVDECKWSSCNQSCTALLYSCKQILVNYNLSKYNKTGISRFYVNSNGCGFSSMKVCDKFFNTYFNTTSEFDCYVAVAKYDHTIPHAETLSVSNIRKLVLSSSPAITSVVICVYLKVRKIFSYGTKKIKPSASLKFKTDRTKSFYERKLSEIDSRKSSSSNKLKTGNGHAVVESPDSEVSPDSDVIDQQAFRFQPE